MLFNLAQSLGSLTASPIQTALDQARRQAQRFEAGGVTHSGLAADHHQAGDAILPAGIDADALGAAIEGTLRIGPGSIRSSGWIRPIVVGADRRLRVPQSVIQLLGDGSVDRGRRLLAKLISAAPAGARRGLRHVRDIDPTRFGGSAAR